MSHEIGTPDQFSIATDKIARYLLDITHPEGGPKARFFLSFGFDAANPEPFAQALFEHACPRHLKRLRRTLWGVKFIFEGDLVTPDGRNPFVRSVWQTGPGGEGTALLVSAYPP